ncbi:NADH-quinone oxidoreductase subunit NuoK [Candidatus Eisenbacteria bacterium]|uniref:NADH-quinone oxidoreductase subunit K n=1 Tax=Eiseniibacteriota bacterium TaxID=2212470 RepID=A0ABV6YIU5_UNCEI
MISIGLFILVGVMLFVIGLAGVLFWKNLLIVLMSIEIMLNGVNLILAAYAAHWQQMDGQVLALFVMLVTAAEVAVALGLTIVVFKRRDTLDTAIFGKLRR